MLSIVPPGYIIRSRKHEGSFGPEGAPSGPKETFAPWGAAGRIPVVICAGTIGKSDMDLKAATKIREEDRWQDANLGAELA